MATSAPPRQASASAYTLVGWNNLGMHCMDADYSVSALLPPYNSIQAQLIDPQGLLVRDPAGITVTYQAVADPDGSMNRTSAGKTNFWEHVPALFGMSLPIDAGLAGNRMPGTSNQPQPMTFDSTASWFTAEGIPITPYDDTQQKNPYPLMRLVARDHTGTVLASTDIVLPVSDEMNCTSCHASGSSPSAQPYAGWVNDPDPQRDMRLNILRLHDDREGGSDTFKNALAAAGFNPAGLFATATTDGHAVLCARCHLSEALRDSGLPGIEPLTQAVHRRMASVFDPVSGTVLGALDNRSACYRCHPGATTRCLRGVMGNAVAADGSRAIQCQSCHGSMLDVASAARTGWLDEPVCQSCHTGTAVNNSGQVRYTSVFDMPGHPRAATDLTFATTPDTPAAGKSLYRFSTGHGGLKCEACHGSTHAEFPSSHRNDNLQSIATQGHAGVLVECASCHGANPQTTDGGPHGMHPVGQDWVDRHHDVVGEGGAGAAQCRACHGTDYRGTVLSRVHADRTVNTEELGTKYFWPGFQVGCYTCHLGPGGGDRNPNRPAAVNNASASTTQDTPVLIPLSATDLDGNVLVLRIVSQPTHGTAGLTSTTAKYFPDPGFQGNDSFSFAAWDGSTDSNLGTVSVSVSGTAAPTSSPTPSPSPTSPAPASATPSLPASSTPSVPASVTPPSPNATSTPPASLTATVPPTSTPSLLPIFTPTLSPNATSTVPATPTSGVPPTSTPSRLPNPTATPSPNPTSTMPASPTPTPVASSTPTMPPAPDECVGDCDDGGSVTVDELIIGVNLALGNMPLPQCPAFDCNQSGRVAVDCLVQAVTAALDGCSDTPLPEATVTRTAPATQTPPPTEPASATPTAATIETPPPMQTAAFTSTATPTQTARDTETAQATHTASATPIPSPTQMPSPTWTATPTQTPIGVESATAAPTASPTQMPSETWTAPPTGTAPPTSTASPTWTATTIPTPTRTQTATSTPTQIIAATSTPPAPTPTATGSTNPNATLANIQANIFSTTCTDLFCHSSTLPAGNLVLEAGTSHDQLVGVLSFNVAAQQAGLLRVKPGDPGNSFLMIKLTGPVPAQGSPMPLGKPALTAAQVQLIRDWITQGALP